MGVGISFCICVGIVRRHYYGCYPTWWLSITIVINISDIVIITRAIIIPLVTVIILASVVIVTDYYYHFSNYCHYYC